MLHKHSPITLQTFGAELLRSLLKIYIWSIRLKYKWHQSHQMTSKRKCFKTGLVHKIAIRVSVCYYFQDAISSRSSYSCQWLGGSVIVSGVMLSHLRALRACFLRDFAILSRDVNFLEIFISASNTAQTWRKLFMQLAPPIFVL